MPSNFPPSAPEPSLLHEPVPPGRRLPRWADALLLLVLCAYLLAGVPIVPFHGDESTLVFMSRDYAYQFLEGDLGLVTYQQPPISEMEQYLRILNGTIPKYMMGLAWHVAGFQPGDINEPWEWGGSYQYNVSVGHRPGDALLNATRLSSALLTCVAVLALFGLAYAVGGRGAAWGAAILFALYPAVMLNGRRSMMEGAMMAFALLTVWAGVWVLRVERAAREPAPGEPALAGQRPGRTRRLLAWVTLGVCMGLALASKHTNTITVGVVGLGILLMCLPAASALSGKFWRGVGLLIGRLLGVGALAFGVFYLLNPSWWGNPLLRVAEIARLRTDLLAAQVNSFGGYAGRIDQLVGFLRQGFGLGLQYYEDPKWVDFIPAEIVRYEASGLAGLHFPGVFSIVVLCVLIGVGAVALVMAARRRTWERGRLLAGLWALAMLATGLLLTPLEWQRYYLPAIMGGCLLAGIGADGLLRLARHIARRRGGQGTQGLPAQGGA